MKDIVKVVGVVGGTGPQGSGAAIHLAKVLGPDVEIRLGSRDVNKAENMAARISGTLREDLGIPCNIRGTSNEDAVEGAQLSLISIPFSGLDSTLPSLRAALAGQIVLETVVPVSISAKQVFEIFVPEGSAGQKIQTMLPDSRVVSVLKTVSEAHLHDPGHTFRHTEFVCGADEEARRLVIELLNRLPGMNAVHQGGISRASWVEKAAMIVISQHIERGLHPSICLVEDEK